MVALKQVMRRVFFLLALSMVTTQVAYSQKLPSFDVQGHRGARGIKPENTIPAFIAALELGVTTLEMDLAVTSDNKVVVSHEPWMSAAYCLDPSGKVIDEKEEMKYNIYKMNYDEVKRWDCGSKVNARFPEQQKMKVTKPLLSEVMVATENYIKNYTRYEVDYNMEIKSMPEGDTKFHPTPEVFSDLVYNLVDQYLPLDRVIIQSFDFRVLKYWHAKYPHVRLAALVENLKTIDENVKELGFVPAIYSPDYKLLSKSEIKHCHELGMKVIPWTVNDKTEMLELKAWNVDGFITDYPNRAKEYKMTLNIQRAK